MKILKNFTGFTLIEIVIVIAVLGTLAAITYSIAVPNWKNKTYYTRAVGETNAMGNAFNLYVAKYNDYPPDVDRNVPGGIKEFLSGQYNDSWPNAPWPGSVYDYDNWPANSYGGQTFQISIRLCPAGEDALCKQRAKKYLKNYVPEDTLNNWASDSSVYYCIKGDCRAHKNKPADYPGFCLNCGAKSKFY